MRHKKHLLDKMKEKGWDSDELSYMNAVLDHSKKSKKHRVLDAFIPWFVFSVMFLCNVAITLVFVPLFLVLTNWILFVMLACLGFIFGLLFKVILDDFRANLNAHHEYLILIIIPFMSLITAYIVLNATLLYIPTLLVELRHPLGMGFVYALFFTAPALAQVLHKYRIRQYRAY
ncbi:MAG: hypothetical protein ACI8Y7_000021 [Candidatus Woesearchaeota archaeon]|jgi:hypothetical protein